MLQVGLLPHATEMADQLQQSWIEVVYGFLEDGLLKDKINIEQLVY